MNIEFIKTSEKLPDKSGEYLCITENDYFAQLPYSAKHKKFNCYDYDSKQESKLYNIGVKFWSKITTKEIERRMKK